MMRLIKFLMKLVLAFLAVGLTFLIIFLFLPSWQKAVLEKALALDEGRRWQVESVRLGPTGLEVDSLFMLDGPVGAEVGLARLEGPLWKIPLLGMLEVDHGEVTGFFVDLSTVRVGDLTSEDWQSFLEKVSGDVEFWQERLGLILQKISANGYEVSLKQLEIRGNVLMPGERMIPVSMLVIEADSRQASKVKIRPLPTPPRAEL